MIKNINRQKQGNLIDTLVHVTPAPCVPTLMDPKTIVIVYKHLFVMGTTNDDKRVQGLTSNVITN